MSVFLEGLCEDVGVIPVLKTIIMSPSPYCMTTGFPLSPSKRMNYFIFQICQYTDQFFSGLNLDLSNVSTAQRITETAFCDPSCT